MRMSVFRDFEKKLESLFEGVFLKAFKSGVQPVELGKKLVREAEENKSIGVSRIYIPNRYTLGLSSSDKSRFESYEAVLVSELENLLINHAKDKEFSLFDRPRVLFTEDKKLTKGQFWVKSRMEGELPTEAARASRRKPTRAVKEGSPAQLVLVGSEDYPQVFPLDQDILTLGRLGTNEIVLPDVSVSRSHARMVREKGEFRIEDLGSTNGTYVNGQRVSSETLNNGDVLRLGNIQLEFRR